MATSETTVTPARTRARSSLSLTRVTEAILYRGAQLLTLFFVAFPIFWLVLTAFKRERDAYSVRLFFEPTLVNFQLLFSPPLNYGPKLVNTIIVAVAAVGLTIPLAMMAAYVFSRYTFKGNTLLFVLVLATQFIPPIVVAMPFFTLFRDLGLLDTLVALVIVNLAVTTPYAIWLIKGFIDGLPHEVEEAAFVDGCSELGVIRHVTLPLVMPGVMVASVFTFIGVWNEFLFAFLLTRNNAATLMIGLQNTVGVQGILWERMAAGGVLVLIPVIIFSIKIRNHFIQGLTLGAVK
jgi:multiple sugar transport system permease protein